MQSYAIAAAYAYEGERTQHLNWVMVVLFLIVSMYGPAHAW